MDQVLDNAKVFVLNNTSKELINFLAITLPGPRASIEAVKHNAINRNFLAAGGMAAPRELQEVPLALARVFGIELFQHDLAMYALNAWKFPMSTVCEFGSDFATEWHKYSWFAYCILAVIATMVEEARSSSPTVPSSGVFTPFEVEDMAIEREPLANPPAGAGDVFETPSALLTRFVLPSLPAAPSKSKRKAKQTPTLSSATTPSTSQGVSVNSMSKASPSMTVSVAKVVAKPAMFPGAITFSPDQFQELLSAIQKRPYEAGACDEDDDKGDDTLSTDTSLTPEVAQLFQIKLEVLKGNELMWLAEADRPTKEKDYDNWYPKLVKVQTVFLCKMAEAVSHLPNLPGIFMAAIIELNSNGVQEAQGKLHFFSQGLFIALKSPKTHKDVPDNIFNTIYRRMASLGAKESTAVPYRRPDAEPKPSYPIYRSNANSQYYHKRRFNANKDSKS